MKMHTENSFQIPHFQKSIIYYFYRIINYPKLIFWIQSKVSLINKKRMKKFKKKNQTIWSIQKDESLLKTSWVRKEVINDNFSLFRKLQVRVPRKRKKKKKTFWQISLYWNE